MFGELKPMHGNPDRFAEGFSGLIAASVLLALWRNGDLNLPASAAKVAYAFFILMIFLGISWAGFGLWDRYGAGQTEIETDI